MPRRFAALRTAALLLAALVLAAVAASCFDLPTSFEVKAVQTAPAPGSPAGAVDLFKWCWNNRNLEHFEEILSDDFQFAISATDSAGAYFRTIPFTRDNTLTSAQHLFVGGGAEPPPRGVSLVFDGTLAQQPDFRPGKMWPWHQQVQVTNLTLTLVRSDGSGLRLTGGALFYVVRGDSAVVPQDLLGRGIRPDSTRWFIERVEDESDIGAPSPASPLPTRKTTWGDILLLYLASAGPAPL